LIGSGSFSPTIPSRLNRLGRRFHMLTDDELINALKSGFSAITPRPDLTERVREQATRDARGPWYRQRRGGRPQRHRRLSGALVPALGILVAVAVAITALTLVGGRSHTPVRSGDAIPLSGAQRRAVERYASIGLRKALRDRSCAPLLRALPLRGARARLDFSDGSPSPQMLSILGVLRRPATASDSFAGLGKRPIAHALRGIYVQYIRRARYALGDAYYIVPAADALGVTPSCITALTRAERTDLPRIPAPLRAATRTLETQRITALKPHQVIAQFEANRGGGSGSCCLTATEIAQRGALGSSTSPSGSVVSGLIPDGVATVQLFFTATGPTGHRANRIVKITATPIDNYIVVKVPHGASPNPRRMIWRSKHNQIIKTIHLS
jgi:hypothetical protein